MARNGNRWITHLVVLVLVVVSLLGFSRLEGERGSIETVDGRAGSRPLLQSEIDSGATGTAASAATGRQALGHQPQSGDPSRDIIAGDLPPAGPDMPPAGPEALDPVSEGLTQADQGANVLRFVYFVEQDREVDPSAVGNISQQAIALQEFWFEQFGGTFNLTDDIVEVVLGDYPAQWYDTTANGDEPRWYRLMNIRAEVRAKLGIENDANVRIVGYPSARIDGRVGANRYSDAWMDGDDITCIDGSVATTPYSSDYPANCLSTVAHELGHVYGLGHQGDEDDCMQFGFYQYVSSAGVCSFSDENRQIVIQDPMNDGWLDAEPGDRA